MSQIIRIDMQTGKNKNSVQVGSDGLDWIITGIPDDHVLRYLALQRTEEGLCFFVIHHHRRIPFLMQPAEFQLHMGQENNLMKATSVALIIRLGQDEKAESIIYNMDTHQVGTLHIPGPDSTEDATNKFFMGEEDMRSGKEHCFPIQILHRLVLPKD